MTQTVAQTTITPIRDALQAIDDGWSSQSFVMQRAVAMRDAYERGDTGHAEVLAHEIYYIQEAENAERECVHRALVGLPVRHYTPPQTTREQWQLDIPAWAEVLIGGAYRRERTFWMDPGATVDEARAQAQTIMASLGHCSPEPVAPMKRTFAMVAE